MRQMIDFSDYLIEKFSDIDKALSFLKVALEEYKKDPDGAALYYGFSAAVEAQGGVQKFALKTHSTPQAVSDALLSKDEIQIAELLKKQVLARRGKDKDIAQNGPLPKGWREVKLGDLCSDIAYGYTATASNEPIGPKFLRITDIVSDSINWESVPYCEIEDSKKHRYTLETGDIVIARTGATTGYNQVVRSNEHSVFASYLIRYKLRQDIAYPFFIGCVLKSTYWKRFVERIKARSAQPGANAKDFASFKILLPTFPEQKAIASLLEKWDTAIEKIEALIEAKEKRFKWLLKTLISDQQDNPEWQQVKLGEISTCYSGGTPSTQVPEYYDGEIPFINSGDLNQRHIKNVKGMLSILGVENSSAKFVKKNTLLMALYGATAGVVAITHIDAVINQAVLAIVVKENHDNSFIFFGLEQMKNTLVKKYRQGGQPNLSAKIIKSIKLRLPSLPEQKRITNILDTAKQEVESLKQLAEQYRTQKRGLMQKLLTGKWRIQI